MNPIYDSLLAPRAGSSSRFLIEPEGREISYADFVARVAQFANALQAAGLEPGDRLALQVEKCADALALIFGCIQSGIVFLPLNTGYTANEIDYFLSDAGARMLVCDPARAAVLSPVAQSNTAMLATLGPRGTGTLAEAATHGSTEFVTVARAPGDLAAFLYTSGTTGRSKGAMLTQDNLLSNAQTLKDEWRFTETDVLLHALPIFHTHGLFVATNVMLAAGGSMVFFPKFDVGAILDWMPQATTMMGVPTFYTRLLDDPRLTVDSTRTMRLFISGSAPLLAETHRAFETRTGKRILERYGMTETNMNTSNPYDGDRRAGTVGLPLPGVELKVCDAEGREVPRGEVGVLEVRGRNVFKGYWNMPEKTREELRSDGFFITGDLARQDPDDYVTIVGRAKDLIISGGYNIYPKEIESLLDEMPGVLESAVVGVAHPDFGETPIAILVPEAGAAPDLAAIEAAVSQALARFKHPRRYILATALPRNTMGKVQKNILRAEHANLFRQ